MNYEISFRKKFDGKISPKLIDELTDNFNKNDSNFNFLKTKSLFVCECNNKWKTQAIISYCYLDKLYISTFTQQCKVCRKICEPKFLNNIEKIENIINNIVNNIAEEDYNYQSCSIS